MLRLICLAFAFVIFVLAAFDIANHEGWNLVALGLAFLTAALMLSGISIPISVTRGPTE